MDAVPDLQELQQTLRLQAERIRVMENQQRSVSEMREALVWRISRVWEIDDPIMFGDLLCWEHHTPGPLAEVVAKQEEIIDQLTGALDKSRIALDDWINTYAPAFCDEARVKAARERIRNGGTLAYLADIQQQNRAALAAVSPATISGGSHGV